MTAKQPREPEPMDTTDGDDAAIGWIQLMRVVRDRGAIGRMRLMRDEVAVGESDQMQRMAKIGEPELMRRRGRLVQCNRARVGEPRTLVSQT